MQSSRPRYVMTLFVTGITARSGRAVANVRGFCESELAGDYDLEVVDLYRAPQRARSEQVVAAPTLVRSEPQPIRRIIGDMSDWRRLRDTIKIA